MDAITIGVNYIFGDFENPGDRPNLPEGWTWKVRPKEWLMVVSPDGQECFVSLTGKAFPRLTFPHEGSEYDPCCTLKEGDKYAETREEIQLFTP